MRGLLSKSLFWICIAVPAAIYVLIIPISTELLRTVEEPLDSTWSIYKEIAFRAAKFWVFSVFTYVGACIGSFLNVVAGSLPKGESIGARNSSCPKCDVPIARTDNLPIYSYFNLGGKCRNCKSLIPARYLTAELVVAAIFGSLFLYQLVTGSFNVADAKVRYHAGVLWIILYPKFDVIGTYLFHVVFMSFLLVFALVEVDRQKLKLRHLAVFSLLLFVPAALYLPLQPIHVSKYLSAIAGHTPLVEHLLKLVIGTLTGVVIGALWTMVSKVKNWTTFVPAFGMTGLVLGWQSVIHVAVLFLVVVLLCKLIWRKRNWWTLMPTAVLLFAVNVHHPVWRIVYDYLNVFEWL